jgi:hypothetical protein
MAPHDVQLHHLNLVSQNVMNYASWGLTAVLLWWTVRMGRREHTPFYFLVVLASMLAAFAEPLYDEAFSLYFYSNHGLQSSYTAFNVPQPLWAYSGYALLYGLPAVFICQKVRQGKMTPKSLFAWAGIELAMSCAFEITGINIGTYTYWGPHVFRIVHYPIVIGILEAAQVMCFAIAASQLRHHAKSKWSYLGLFALFPVTFFGANFGAGSAVILAIHVQGASKLAISLCTLVSIGLAISLVQLVSVMIPPASPDAIADAASEQSAPARERSAAAVG